MLYGGCTPLSPHADAREVCVTFISIFLLTVFTLIYIFWAAFRILFCLLDDGDQLETVKLNASDYFSTE
jgi:hypothetical protein